MGIGCNNGPLLYLCLCVCGIAFLSCDVWGLGGVIMAHYYICVCGIWRERKENEWLKKGVGGEKNMGGRKRGASMGIFVGGEVLGTGEGLVHGGHTGLRETN